MVIRTKSPQQMAFNIPEPVRIWNAPSEWKTPESLPELDGLTALDFETKDPGIGKGTGSSWAIPGEGFICGAAVVNDSTSVYAPIAHAAGNMDPMLFWTWLRKQAAKPSVTFVMANSIYDAGWLARHNITPANDPYDVQSMAYLLNEHRRSNSLSALSKEYLGTDKSSNEFHEACKAANIFAPMSNMDKVPAWMAAPYGITDARLTHELFHHLLPLLEAEDLLRVHELERASAMVAVDMRKLGVKIDMARVEQIRKTFTEKRDAALKSIFDATGVPVAPFDVDAACRALRAENSEVQLGTTATGKDSVAKEILTRINSPVSNAILSARRYDKAIGTFIDGYLVAFQHNGRIHPEIHPTRRTDNNDSEFAESSGGTTSGRFSMSNPNLQNVPARDPEIGPAVRSCFVPDDGEWGKLDYASQEPRLTVHYAGLTRVSAAMAARIKDEQYVRLGVGPLRGALEMLERFRNDPMTDLHGECAALMNVSRKNAKTINLALAYGAQGANICHQLGLPTQMITTRRGITIEVAGPEGQALIDKHFESVPFVKGLFCVAKQLAEDTGYVRTLSGRRIRFEQYADGSYIRTHKALNGIIQGSAADQMKMALVAFRREKIAINLTVHDEADRWIPFGDEGARMKKRLVEIMEGAAPISIPMIAEISTGPNWGEVQ